MKKTYIEPKNVVVRIETEALIANSSLELGGTQDGIAGAREIIEEEYNISSPDAWEEW